jgi:hypothetical protein
MRGYFFDRYDGTGIAINFEILRRVPNNSLHGFVDFYVVFVGTTYISWNG